MTLYPADQPHLCCTCLIKFPVCLKALHCAQVTAIAGSRKESVGGCSAVEVTLSSLASNTMKMNPKMKFGFEHSQLDTIPTWKDIAALKAAADQKNVKKRTGSWPLKGIFLKDPSSDAPASKTAFECS